MAEKRYLIQRICQLSKGEKPELLANWSEEELADYLNHLLEMKSKKLVVSRSA